MKIGGWPGFENPSGFGLTLGFASKPGELASGGHASLSAPLSSRISISLYRHHVSSIIIHLSIYLLLNLSSSIIWGTVGSEIHLPRIFSLSLLALSCSAFLKQVDHFHGLSFGCACLSSSLQVIKSTPRKTGKRTFTIDLLSSISLISS